MYIWSKVFVELFSLTSFAAFLFAPDCDSSNATMTDLRQQVWHAFSQGAIHILKQCFEQAPQLVNLADSNNNTLLYLACANGQEVMATFLMDWGADINKKGPAGSTALHGACWHGKQSIVHELLRRGANTTITNDYGDVAENDAKAKGHQAVLQLFKSPPEKFPRLELPPCEYTPDMFVENPNSKTGHLPNVFADGVDQSNWKKRIRIVCLSDTHTRHTRAKIPPGDILIHSGDFTNDGNPAAIAEFEQFLKSQPHTYKIVISGNHESGIDQFTKAEIQQKLPSAIYLQDSGVNIGGIKIWGSPWTNCNWAFSCPYNDGWGMQSAFGQIPDGTGIVVTHNPPHNIIDLAWLSLMLKFDRQWGFLNTNFWST